MKHIEIYGMGCDKYFETVKSVEKILSSGKIKASFSAVTDRNEIAKKDLQTFRQCFLNKNKKGSY